MTAGAHGILKGNLEHSSYGRRFSSVLTKEMVSRVCTSLWDWPHLSLQCSRGQDCKPCSPGVWDSCSSFLWESSQVWKFLAVSKVHRVPSLVLETCVLQYVYCMCILVHDIPGDCAPEQEGKVPEHWHTVTGCCTALRQVICWNWGTHFQNLASDCHGQS